MRPTFILSEGAQPANTLDNAGAKPNPAVVSAVFLIKTLLVVIFLVIYTLSILLKIYILLLF
jgi:hypothetical protein